jgi:hypothetical protein
MRVVESFPTSAVPQRERLDHFQSSRFTVQSNASDHVTQVAALMILIVV